jgi:hypothetical protein
VGVLLSGGGRVAGKVYTSQYARRTSRPPMTRTDWAIALAIVFPAALLLLLCGGIYLHG